MRNNRKLRGERDGNTIKINGSLHDTSLSHVHKFSRVFLANVKKRFWTFMSVRFPWHGTQYLTLSLTLLCVFVLASSLRIRDEKREILFGNKSESEVNNVLSMRDNSTWKLAHFKSSSSISRRFSSSSLLTSSPRSRWSSTRKNWNVRRNVWVVGGCCCRECLVKMKSSTRRQHHSGEREKKWLWSFCSV